MTLQRGNDACAALPGLMERVPITFKTTRTVHAELVEALRKASTSSALTAWGSERLDAHPVSNRQKVPNSERSKTVHAEPVEAPCKASTGSARTWGVERRSANPCEIANALQAQTDKPTVHAEPVEAPRKASTGSARTVGVLSDGARIRLESIAQAFQGQASRSLSVRAMTLVARRRSSSCRRSSARLACDSSTVRGPAP